MNVKLLLLMLIIGMVGSAQAACNDCILEVIPIQNNICQDECTTYQIKITNAFDQA